MNNFRAGFLERLVKQRFRSTMPGKKTNLKYINSGESEVHFIKRTKGRSGMVLKVIHSDAHQGMKKVNVASIVKGYADELNKIANESAKHVNYYNERMDVMNRFLQNKLRRGESFDPYENPERHLREAKQNAFIPHVAQVRSPTVFAYETLKDGKHAILMEEIVGPTLGELTTAANGGLGKSERDLFVRKFIERHNLDLKQLKKVVSEVTEGLTSTTRRWSEYPGLGFRYEEDSFIVEGIDKTGKLKLVLVDFR